MTNPFDAIPINKDVESIKVWDLPAFDSNHNEGRIRILAVVPKKPHPLNDIRVSISWCAPVDLKRFTKKRSNQILVGRWLKSFGTETETSYSNTVCNNSARVTVDTLKDFPINVFKAVQVPNWAVFVHKPEDFVTSF